jgi:hypothetical protein
MSLYILTFNVNESQLPVLIQALQSYKDSLEQDIKVFLQLRHATEAEREYQRKQISSVNALLEQIVTATTVASKTMRLDIPQTLAAYVKYWENRPPYGGSMTDAIYEFFADTQKIDPCKVHDEDWTALEAAIVNHYYRQRGQS